MVAVELRFGGGKLEAELLLPRGELREDGSSLCFANYEDIRLGAAA
jgi:hypothetical protein